ncbi:hypothetical protein F6453_0650 [Marinobacter nauticus]|uniref:Uncharacterized protein n=1 Tax=Marinobacter nauticus TaxID=2743 RepID=A0A833JVM6_MARNT|nr:hypothetical protein F6453_0650 [Marinobacter nauticus]
MVCFAEYTVGKAEVGTSRLNEPFLVRDEPVVPASSQLRYPDIFEVNDEICPLTPMEQPE